MSLEMRMRSVGGTLALPVSGSSRFWHRVQRSQNQWSVLPMVAGRFGAFVH